MWTARGGRGCSLKVHISPQGGGGVMVLSMWTKYIGFFHIFMILQDVLILLMVGKNENVIFDKRLE